ncbi:MAG: ribosomal protein S18-alanine N-acetyltransferase [Oscillospiraceae bacterium]|nr:ribosomal protein S18-alanine N-acetyltransferase [Oscillospiraceae bacterium]
MEIIRMTADHVAQVAAIEKECFGREGWSQRSVTGELTNALALWLVAVDGDRVAGYVGSQTVCGETDMMNVAVTADFRRRGIAEKLVLALVDELKAIGSRCLTLEVRASNTPAQALYEKLGFTQVGRRPKYYQNPREDALILRKEWEN